MKTKSQKSDTMKMIDDIKESLDRILEHMAWMIRSEQRFSKGQRVQFSRLAIKRGFPRSRKGVAIKGRVVKIDGPLCVSVLLDGYKHPKSYHHSLFNPVTGAKMF